MEQLWKLNMKEKKNRTTTKKWEKEKKWGKDKRAVFSREKEWEELGLGVCVVFLREEL